MLLVLAGAGANTSSVAARGSDQIGETFYEEGMYTSYLQELPHSASGSGEVGAGFRRIAKS
jgi:hypothetical protein